MHAFIITHNMKTKDDEQPPLIGSPKLFPVCQDPWLQLTPHHGTRTPFREYLRRQELSRNSANANHNILQHNLVKYICATLV